jgi:predicted ribosomally synthesized peptide with nif11-like leader
MSVNKVEEFLNQIAEDEALQADLAKALEAENDRAAVTELANSKGYDFSSEELWAEIQKRQAEFEQKQTAGELSDEELEAIAGGISPTFIFTAKAVGAGLAGIGVGIAVSKIKW